MPLPIFADTEQMHQAARDFDSKVVQLADLLHEINGDITQLQAAWRGLASDQFEVCIGEWKTSYNEMQQALEGISATLAKAGLAYADLDDNIKRAFATGS
jgi:WXG100 family type VII secretion target